MDVTRTTPSKIFFATHGGAGINFGQPCLHGDPALSLHLFSREADTVEDIGILLPTCFAPDLFGMALAYIEAVHGPRGGRNFLNTMLTRRDESLPVLAKRRAAYEAGGAACCVAAALTRGRDHTCGRTS